MKNYAPIAAAFVEATKKGFSEIGPGLLLESSENMTAEQLQWDDEDESKDIDFSIYPFWLTTDNGNPPIGIADLADLAREMK